MTKEDLKNFLFETLNEHDSLFSDLSLDDETDTIFIKSVDGEADNSYAKNIKGRLEKLGNDK